MQENWRTVQGLLYKKNNKIRLSGSKQKKKQPTTKKNPNQNKKNPKTREQVVF